MGNFDAVFVNIHTYPDEAYKEIPDLAKVREDASDHFDEPDVILLGDLNADCAYYDEESINSLRTDYHWLVPNSADTNVSTSSSCAYDRIIVTVLLLLELDNPRTDYKFDK